MMRLSTVFLAGTTVFSLSSDRAQAQRIAEGYHYDAPSEEKLNDAAAHAKLLNWVEDAARAREQLVYFRNTSDQPLDITSYEFYECLNVSGVKCSVEHVGPRLEPGETIVLQRIRHRNMEQRMSYRYRFTVRFAAPPPPPRPGPGAPAPVEAPYVTPETGWSSERTAYVERVMPILMRQHAVPGVSIVLVDGPQTQWSRTFGVEFADGPPVDEETVFPLGSLADAVVALTFQRLADVRGWNLDGPISTWAHEESYPAGFGSLSAADLLSYSAGVSYDGTGETWRRDPTEQAWRQSPDQYALLRHLVELAEGHDFAVLARALVWVPHSLVSMRFGPPASAEHLARGHDGAGHPRTGDAPDAAAGGLFSTAADYARFLVAISPMSQLEPEVWRTLTRERVTVDEARGLSWGLGWGVTRAGDGSPLAFNHGVGPGYSSFALIDERQARALVILTNGDNGQALIADVLPLLDPRGIFQSFEAR